MGRCILEKWVSTGLAMAALVIGTALTLLESAVPALTGYTNGCFQTHWEGADWENDWLLNYGNWSR